MSKVKENLEAVIEVQKLIKEGQFKISRTLLAKLGVDTGRKAIFLRNIKLEKDSMFNDWNFCSIDKYADMNGKPIIENQNFIKRIHKLYDEGKMSITSKELINDFNIFNAAENFKVENFNLNCKSRLNVYEIKLIKIKKSKPKE